jgi:hypothetical protein
MGRLRDGSGEALQPWPHVQARRIAAVHCAIHQDPCFQPCWPLVVLGVEGLGVSVSCRLLLHLPRVPSRPSRPTYETLLQSLSVGFFEFRNNSKLLS